LIGGMKFAFGSSVAGMIFALLIKRKYIKEKIKQEINEQNSENDAFDVESVLKAILDIRSSLVGGKDSLVSQFQELKNDLNENVNKISRAISGDDDSSVVTQVKLFRGESRDELAKLNKSVDKFYEEIAGKGTDVLLEALKTIISDFNKNLNEQFGENFKELNDAVGKILEWQIQYKEQLNAMIETQKQTSGDMKVATEAFNALLEKAESLTTVGSDFKVIVNDLSALLQALEQQRNDISNHIKLFADISEKASNGLPKLEEKISDLSQDLIDVIGNHNSKINDHLETTISKSGELNRQMSEAMTKNNEELNQHIEQAVERTNEQVVKLDQAMSEELTKALESFGKQLTSLSQTFVKDYTPLTEKLKEVVEISKRL
jgi:CHASE3 domain sensor protein